YDGDFNVSATIRDLTHQVAMEVQLRQAQKMEAIGQLTGGVAHDFNNLLTVIVGHLELAAEALPSESPARRHVETAIAAADRSASLPQGLRAFARRQALSPKISDLGALVERTAVLLRRTLGEVITVEVALPRAPLSSMLDEAQLETALLNLALNARDAMPKGG